jgi:luciferase family oxidoreductase group 1
MLMSAYAARAEELGMRRFWVAEHHGSRGIASVVPPVLIARLSAQTKSIRVGAGGVMLPNHSPLAVAEQFASLAALVPGRTDLGIGRGPGTADPEVAALLRRGRPPVTEEEYAGEIAATLGYLSADPAPLGSLAGFMPSPWLLASSESGARLAARFGLPLSFAHHIHPASTESALALYRSEFRPSQWLERPYVMLGVMTICADSDERADELARPFEVLLAQFSRHESAAVLPVSAALEYQFSAEDEERVRARRSAQAVGAPDTVRQRISSLVATAMPDELMLTTPVYDIGDRLRSLDLVLEHAVRPRRGGERR